MRRLIINADDYGLSDGICRAIHGLFDAGSISSTTIMVAANGAIKRCENWNVRQLRGSAGVHLQLTDGRPILPAEQVPSLTDKRTGLFLPKSHLSHLNPLDVKKEWRAQIELAQYVLGQKPSHVDTHHGANHVPHLSNIFIDLAAEFGLPVRDSKAMRDFQPNIKLAGSDIVIYDWTGHGSSVDELERQIAEAVSTSTSNEVIEVVAHPGFADEELRGISSLNNLREIDFDALLHLAQEKWLNANGIRLVDFSDFTL